MSNFSIYFTSIDYLADLVLSFPKNTITDPTRSCYFYSSSRKDKTVPASIFHNKKQISSYREDEGDVSYQSYQDVSYHRAFNRD
jgi:hypothetical protein